MSTSSERKAPLRARRAREAASQLFGHDIIVIGGSAGAIEPLITIASALPRGLAAALFVVVHRSVETPQLLPHILRRQTGLQVVQAVDGMAIEHGRIYVAPPDRHLLLDENAVQVVRGPKENRHRPAIDPLFRSAAWTYGPRVAGILLSGGLNDGSAGLWAIRSCGGIAAVQDPSDARFSSMPQSALDSMDVEYCVSADRLAALIERVVQEPAADRASFPVPRQVELESQMIQMKKDDIEHVDSIGALSPFTCPQCSGALWEIDDAHVLRYRCHTGHAFTAESLAADEEDSVEEALYSGLRALEESATLSRRMARRAHERTNGVAASALEEKARTAQKNADTLRRMLLGERPSEQRNVRRIKRAR